ncbi:hypothetical protein FM102_07335 [Corynebacterium glutamicum]|nr:hypothetical protein FM102_07335 [Corynebacterium glutamicum]
MGFFAAGFDRINKFTAAAKLLARIFNVLGLSRHLAHLP